MPQLTPHFHSDEFLDSGSRARRDPPTMLLGVLEHLRGQIGRPLRIVSGYRTPETNKRVGGAADSRHVHGDAADIPTGLVRLHQAEAAGATGIGTKDGWVLHVDVRPGGPARWTY